MSDSGAAPHGAGTDDARAQRDRHLAACLQRVMRGDAAAFEAFYDATAAHAHSLARRMLRSDEVDDLLAEVYFEVWRTAPRFDAARGSAMTWLLVMVRSRCLDWLRQRSAHPSVSIDADDAQALPEADSAEPGELLWRSQCDERLHAALRELGSAERWVLGLAYFRELTHAQVAAATGWPLGTVKSLIHRAQAHLRERLAPNAVEGVSHGRQARTDGP